MVEEELVVGGGGVVGGCTCSLAAAASPSPLRCRSAHVADYCARQKRSVRRATCVIHLRSFHRERRTEVNLVLGVFGSIHCRICALLPGVPLS